MKFVIDFHSYMKQEKIMRLYKCVELCLMDNYFLHFERSWHESSMWKIKNIFESKKINFLNKKFKEYEKRKIKS